MCKDEMVIKMRGICVFCISYHRHLSEPVELMWVHGVKSVQAERQPSGVTAVGGKHWALLTGKCLLPQDLPCHRFISQSSLCLASQLAARNQVPELTGCGQIRAIRAESWGLPLEKVLRKCSMDCAFAGEAEGVCILSNFYSTFFSQLFWEVCLSYQLPACCCRT